METVCPASIVVAFGVMVAGLGRNRGASSKTIMTPQTMITARKTFRIRLSNEGKGHDEPDLRDLKLYEDVKALRALPYV
jgi:hypothetical protein